jgi:peroxiredoxin
MTNETGINSHTIKWRGLSVNLLLFVVVMVGIRFWQQRDIASGIAPTLQGVTLAGKPYNLPAHPAQPVLVHFWATWCSICRIEQGSIASLAHNDPSVVTIAMQSGKPEEVARHMGEQHIDFPVVNDTDGRISSAWGVHAVPASFIITSDGSIRFVEVGYTTGLGLRFRLWLAGL